MKTTASTIFCAIVFASIIPVAPAVSAQPQPIEPYPTAAAAYSECPPVIDGDLDDPQWQEAAELGPFCDMRGEPVTNRTTARVLRCADTLFIGVSAQFEKDTELTVDQTARDSEVFTDDCIEVFVDPRLDFRNYYHLLVNAANVQRDERGDKAKSPSFDVDWDGNWQSATKRAPAEWTMEMAVPLETFGLKPNQPAVIGLNVCRADKTAGELSCWSPTLSGFHQPVRFGVVSLPTKPTDLSVAIQPDLPQHPTLGSSAVDVILEPSESIAGPLEGLVVAGNGQSAGRGGYAVSQLAAQQPFNTSAEYDLEEPGPNAIVLAALAPDGNAVGLCKSVISVSQALARKYGSKLAGGEALGLWSCASTYKVHKDKPMPQAETEHLELSAAGREYEAVQIVLRPPNNVDVAATITDFTGPAGAVIPADQFQLREAVYVPVSIPTDSFGWVGDWPDPLPLLDGPLHCKAGQNQPIWLVAHVPAGTRPGWYEGQLQLSADGDDFAVPIRLRVWGFDLTPETHIRTAYGVGPNYGFQGVSDAEQRKQVYDLFMQCCRDHRISPYSPMAHYDMDIDVLAPMRKYASGRMAVEIEIGQQYPWKLHWDGERVATQRTSMTHFEHEGVGWKGTGVGWPYIDSIESVKQVSADEHMTVLEVIGEHTGSAPAARSFRLTFQLYIPAGDNWFGWKLIQMQSTDETEITIRQYYNIPRTEFEARRIANGKDFAAWSNDEIGFGMLRLGSGVGGPAVEKGKRGITMGNSVPEFNIKKPETHPGWGPLVIYFVTDRTSPEELAEHAAALRDRIDPENPTEYRPANPMAITREAREGYDFSHDFADFDKGAKRYLDEFHFNGFNMRCMPGQIAGHKRFTDEYIDMHLRMYTPVIEHLRENGWLQYAYSYWFDEPTEEEYEYVGRGMGVLRANCPGLTRLLTEQPEEPLYDVVNLWVPVLSRYRAEDCHARQKAGDHVWWYVCCGPKAPYPNNFVDHPAINHRIRFWMAKKFRVEGSLYWSTTHYGHTPDGEFRNPWKDAMTYRPSGGYWGNGDGMLLYPPCRERSDEPLIEGPVPSLRFEMLRDGIEDYEYLWRLGKEIERLRRLRHTAPWSPQNEIGRALQAAKRAMAAPDRLIESLVKYEKDPEKLLAERERIARIIEACRRIR